MILTKSLLPLTLLTVCLLPACSHTNTASTDGSTTAVTDGHIDEKTLFSSLQELDYSPSAEDYIIGPSDLLDISVFQADEFSKQVRVEDDGNISVPLLADIPAAGLTTSQLEQRVAEQLKQKYLQNPKVTVTVKEYNSRSITLDGLFGSPGVYPITGTQINVLQALALGDGLSDLANDENVVLFRKTGENVKAYRLDIDAIRAGKIKAPYVRNNDILVAHRSDSRYWLREVAALMTNFNTIDSVLKTIIK